MKVLSAIEKVFAALGDMERCVEDVFREIHG